MIFQQAGTDSHFSGAVAFNLMMLMGTTISGCLLAKSAAVAQAQLRAQTGDSKFWSVKINTSLFFMQQVLPRTETFLSVIKSGSATTMAMGDEQF